MPATRHIILGFNLTWRRAFAVGYVSVVLLLPTPAHAEVRSIVAPTMWRQSQPTASVLPVLSVPESSLYGMMGAVLIGGLALWRNQRAKKLKNSSAMTPGSDEKRSTVGG